MFMSLWIFIINICTTEKVFFFFICNKCENANQLWLSIMLVMFIFIAYNDVNWIGHDFYDFDIKMIPKKNAEQLASLYNKFAL